MYWRRAPAQSLAFTLEAWADLPRAALTLGPDAARGAVGISTAAAFTPEYQHHGPVYQGAGGRLAVTSAEPTMAFLYLATLGLLSPSVAFFLLGKVVGTPKSPLLPFQHVQFPLKS